MPLVALQHARPALPSPPRTSLAQTPLLTANVSADYQHTVRTALVLALDRELLY